jgi:hypothetical protein
MKKKKNENNQKRNRIIISVIVLVLSFAVYFAYNNNKTATLTILSDEWSGYVAVADPFGNEEGTTSQDITNTVTVKVKEGQTFRPTSKFEDVEFKVKKITSKEVVIEANKPLSSVTDDGISLYDTQKEFTIKKGEDLKLATPTLDAGCTYVITY